MHAVTTLFLLLQLGLQIHAMGGRMSTGLKRSQSFDPNAQTSSGSPGSRSHSLTPSLSRSLSRGSSISISDAGTRKPTLQRTMSQSDLLGPQQMLSEKSSRDSGFDGQGQDDIRGRRDSFSKGRWGSFTKGLWGSFNRRKDRKSSFRHPASRRSDSSRLSSHTVDGESHHTAKELVPSLSEKFKAMNLGNHKQGSPAQESPELEMHDAFDEGLPESDSFRKWLSNKSRSGEQDASTSAQHATPHQHLDPHEDESSEVDSFRSWLGQGKRQRN